MSEIKSNQVDAIYSLRKKFSIIGITGRMSAGCGEIANRLSQTRADLLKYEGEQYRGSWVNNLNPSDLKEEDFGDELFRRKYDIVKRFCQKNWKEYSVIEYKKVLILYLLDIVKNEPSPKQSFITAIDYLFQKSKVGLDNDLKGEYPIDPEYIEVIWDMNKIDNLTKNIKDINIRTENDKEKLSLLAEQFFNPSYSMFYSSLVNHLDTLNHYLKAFLFHKLGNNIRSINSYRHWDEGEVDTSNIYNVASVINRLIKATKTNKGNCHIVIDGIKNSLEVMFFKERYSAFYMVSVHNEKGYKERIESKIIHRKQRVKTLEKLIDLDNIEHDGSEFGKGQFFSTDVENCIQKSEIHVRFIDENSAAVKNVNEFYSITEQLMKIQALIQQPGIITPTGVERCMQVAYNSKFNSGCISRQVGAVITDSGLSIKSVGWNDVPQNTITCLLRSVKDLQSPKVDIAYSEFENKNSDYKYTENALPIKNKKYVINKKHIGKNFASNLAAEFSDEKLKAIEQEGKNCSFCFKTNHNKFEGEKNQVHTRSLHAEENAMLQISKFGGQQVKGGCLFTTASPCELCAKKAYQLGIKKVYFIDKYPGISIEHILSTGTNCPEMVAFTGVIGKAYNKLYEPLMSYKDELGLYN